jgi:hypothetical protein
MESSYKCDRCSAVHELCQEKIVEMEYYVSPSSCYGGDYYIHDYYFFLCVCGRPIEVKKLEVKNQYNLPKVNGGHGNGRCTANTRTY